IRLRSRTSTRPLARSSYGRPRSVHSGRGRAVDAAEAQSQTSWVTSTRRSCPRWMSGAEFSCASIWGERSSAGAVEHARDLARTIVQMGATSSSWELLDGCAFVRAGHWWGSTIHPSVKIPENPVYEPTGRFLADLDPDLVSGLVARLQPVEELAA